ncbi:MAG: hypothetical protein ACPGU1_00495 [Myxococcota bacterium]
MVRLRSSVAALIVSLVASSALAAMPSGDEMLTHIAAMQPAATPFVVNYVEVPSQGIARVAVRVLSDGQGRARIDLQDLQGGVSRSRFFGAVTQGAVESLDRAPIWLQWWMARPATMIAKVVGIDAGVRSLGHADGEILWVVGASPKQQEVPQLHVERETGRLRRAVDAGDAGPIAPARLDEYVTHEGVVTRFPKRLTLRINRRDVVLVNTWLREGDATQFGPEEFLPAKTR